MKNSNYTSPSMHVLQLKTMNVLLASKHNVEDYNYIDRKDIDLSLLPYERVLVAYKNYRLMENGGFSISGINKVHLFAKELSPQRFICVMTNQRLILIPQDTKEKAQRTISFVGGILGVDYFTKKYYAEIATEKYLTSSVVIQHAEIKSITLSEEAPPTCLILDIETIKGHIYLSHIDNNIDCLLNLQGAFLFPDSWTEKDNK